MKLALYQNLGDLASSKYGDKIDNEIEHKNFNAGDINWLAYSWRDY